jgi:hypothetical protein
MQQFYIRCSTPNSTQCRRSCMVCHDHANKMAVIPCCSHIMWYSTHLPSGLHSFRHILKENHHILLSELSTCNLLPCLPFNHLPHPPNLHQLLVRNNLDPGPHILQFVPTFARDSTIQPDPHRPAAQSLTRPVTNLIYPLHTHATCSSSKFIYLLTCTQCDAFYKDEIKNSLSTRMNGHYSSSNNLNNSSILCVRMTKTFMKVEMYQLRFCVFF